MPHPRILVINPGSTSTKIALFEGPDQVRAQEVSHPAAELARFKSNLEQLEFRRQALNEALNVWGITPADCAAIIGRGGPLKPLRSGVYRINEAYLTDIREGRCVDHASILGGMLAHALAAPAGRPAFIADPVSVDEFEEVARLSGWPALPRPTYSHALNIKAVIREWAAEQGRPADRLNVIVAHLGGGISVAAHRQGRLIDVESSSDSGPFSPERAGTLPLSGLLKLLASDSRPVKDWRKIFNGQAGLVAHLGTADVREVEARIVAGDAKAALVLEAMAYGVAKAIGAMAVVLAGQIDAIILTGGIAYNARVVNWISDRVRFLAPVVVKPGQNEMKALAAHALNALANPAIVQEYV